VLKERCASSSVTYPSSIPEIKNLKTNTYSIIRETPITISGFTTGMLLILNTVLLLTGFMACIPIAAAVPKTTAIRVENSAIEKVVLRAFSIR
jgi:hypothetical protein